MKNVGYRLVDVFAEGAFTGNALAVFPRGEDVAPDWMPRIARELNLSETTFVTSRAVDSYDVRIFTLNGELPFAGHPTVGTCWVLRKLGVIRAPRVVQTSAGGRTLVSIADGTVWFERSGSIVDRSVDTTSVAEALGLRLDQIGRQSWTVGGRALHASASLTDAGLPVLLVPVDSRALATLRPSSALSSPSRGGVYCWAVVDSATIKARFFAPSLGVAEDPATGSAAAALGIYLASQLGETRFEISQGAEVGRPSRILVEASAGRVKVGGTVIAIGQGTISVPSG